MWILTITLALMPVYDRASSTVNTVTAEFQTEEACVTHADNVLNSWKDMTGDMKYAKSFGAFSCSPKS